MPDAGTLKDILQPLEVRKEFCLTDKDLDFCRKYKDWILEKIQRPTVMGVTFEKVLHMLTDDDLVEISIKKTQDTFGPAKVYSDIRSKEKELLEHGIVEFTPSYFLEESGLIAQRWLSRDKELSQNQVRKAREDFEAEIRSKGVRNVGNFGENVVITKNGPGIVDVLDCRFDQTGTS